MKKNLEKNEKFSYFFDKKLQFEYKKMNIQIKEQDDENNENSKIKPYTLHIIVSGDNEFGGGKNFLVNIPPKSSCKGLSHLLTREFKKLYNAELFVSKLKLIFQF